MLFLHRAGEFLAGRVIPPPRPGFSPAQTALAARLTRIVLPPRIFFYIGGSDGGAVRPEAFYLPPGPPYLQTPDHPPRLLLGGTAGWKVAWESRRGVPGNFALQSTARGAAASPFPPGSTSPTRA